MSYGNERDRQRCHKEYMGFRRRVPKRDVTFLDDRCRRGRICETVEQLDVFVNGILGLADAAAETGSDVVVVLDVETEYSIPGSTKRKPDPYFWHRRQLREDGISEVELKGRESFQRQSDAEYAAIKNQKTRQNRRATFRANAREHGMVKSDVFCFQMSCVQDEESEYTFIANPVLISDKSFAGGRLASPPLERLMRHPNVIWVNSGIHGDLLAMSDCFFDGGLIGMRHVELKTLVEDALGEKLTRREDVDGCGVLGIFQRVFLQERWTWEKDPLLTRSHWWDVWTKEMVEYAFNDVFSVDMVLRQILPNLNSSIRDFAAIFPADAPLC